MGAGLGSGKDGDHLQSVGGAEDVAEARPQAECAHAERGVGVLGVGRGHRFIGVQDEGGDAKARRFEVGHLQGQRSRRRLCPRAPTATRKVYGPGFRVSP